MTNIPPHLSKYLDTIGIVLLVKKPKPMPQPTAWKPTPDQQEPPF